MDFIRAKRVSVGMDLAPLIDCVFLLLIFFMLSATFLNPTLKLKLPAASTREAADADRLVVSIDADGQVFLNQEPVALENLKATLAGRLQTAPRKQVSFRGDRDMRYELFVQVMDIARQAGAEQLNIAHQVHER